jgi:hypothetical protein
VPPQEDLQRQEAPDRVAVIGYAGLMLVHQVVDRFGAEMLTNAAP